MNLCKSYHVTDNENGSLLLCFLEDSEWQELNAMLKVSGMHVSIKDMIADFYCKADIIWRRIL